MIRIARSVITVGLVGLIAFVGSMGSTPTNALTATDTTTNEWSVALVSAPTEQISIALDGTLFARTNEGWFASGGSRGAWSRVPLPPRGDGLHVAVAIDPTDSNTLYAG